ncbi:MAG TPA: hypothetical protein VHK66_00795 [Microvirga sp.]|jgi:hypothetical protein|nr:hypothetical protein [Microvirga sp.]
MTSDREKGPRDPRSEGEKARLRSGIDQGVEAGGPAPKSRGGGQSQSIAESEQVATGRDDTAPVRPEGDDEDVLSRAKE